MSNQVQQCDLDRCLLRGIQIVQRKERKLAHVAQALTLLLQSGANWNNDVLLDDQKTPLHIICKSRGDHHKLLDLMIKSSQQTITNTGDFYRHTALMCAVEKANINCVKCLLANDADVTIGDDTYQSFISREIQPLTPIMKVIWMFRCGSKYSSVIMYNIFELLLDAAVDQDKDYFKSSTDYILCALHADNVKCINKLIEKGAPLDSMADDNFSMWILIAMKGDVELLKCMFNHGIDKDSINPDGLSVLWWVIISGNVEAVRYLLDLGVHVPTYVPEVRETPCEQCKENRLILEGRKLFLQDPCINAICLSINTSMLEIVKLLEEYGSESCKSFYALRLAVIHRRVDVVSYLLNKYTYPLNIEYLIKDYDESINTLLTEPYTGFTAQTTKLLLDHGADPAKQMCSAKSPNAIMTAIRYGRLDAIAQYIRSGVDINFRSWDSTYGKVSPFEASVLHDRPYVSVMLLISGCSRKFKVNAKPKLEKLMKEWNVYDDNVIPLKQRCRNVILNHLSPRADLKIKKLPLPGCLIKFLGIPELDNIVYEY